MVGAAVTEATEAATEALAIMVAAITVVAFTPATIRGAGAATVAGMAAVMATGGIAADTMAVQED